MRAPSRSRYETPRLRPFLDLRLLHGVGDEPLFLRCPFHDDAYRPNLCVNKEYTYCFACGEHETALEHFARVVFDVSREELSDRFSEITAAFERWVCQQNGVERVEELWSEGRPVVRSEEKRVAKAKRVTVSEIPLERVQRYHETLLARPEKLDWLLRRGLTEETVARELLGYHEQGAYVIPVWSQDRSTVRTLRYRRDDDVDPERDKYWSEVGTRPEWLYNLPSLGDATWTVLTEGELDALRVSQMGFPAVSYLGGVLSVTLDLLPEQITFVVLCLDQDLQGMRRMLDVVRSRPKRELALAILRWDEELGKDVTEFVQRAGEDAFRELLYREVPWLKPTSSASTTEASSADRTASPAPHDERTPAASLPS